MKEAPFPLQRMDSFLEVALPFLIRRSLSLFSFFPFFFSLSRSFSFATASTFKNVTVCFSRTVSLLFISRLCTSLTCSFLARLERLTFLFRLVSFRLVLSHSTFFLIFFFVLIPPACRIRIACLFSHCFAFYLVPDRRSFRQPSCSRNGRKNGDESGPASSDGETSRAVGKDKG